MSAYRVREATFTGYVYPAVRVIGCRGEGELMIGQTGQPAREFAPTCECPSGWQAAVPGGLLVLSPLQVLEVVRAIQTESIQLASYVFSGDGKAERISDTRWRKAG